MGSDWGSGTGSEWGSGTGSGTGKGWGARRKGWPTACGRSAVTLGATC
jgi:hypothetical protein